MKSKLDLSDFSFTSAKAPAIATGLPLQSSKKPPHHKQGDKFLKGPIPWNWVKQAAALPGKALHVAIVLWFWAGIKSLRTVNLPPSTVRQIGISRHSAYRGLSALEQAGLVLVKRHKGKSAEVTLLDGTDVNAR